MAHALTRIRLNGFKTFAQRTEVELPALLTAVVGPNGCGKSNLVDAIVWALGETSVRTLRATTATEVLFNGSASAKPMGLAEVSLWFNNETRWLPLDADEVQVTRRIYRSGEWECWINKTPARLRDVADLFAGTGLGRGGYAIVGQGDIEAFLNADPETRRLWLEEVAGVALYRQRRRSTLRDLELAQLHLQRVEDVLRELDRQREPLRQQAERALLYRELLNQLQQKERQRILHDWHSLHAQLQHALTERDRLHQQVVETELAIQEDEHHAEQYGQQISALEAEMDTVRSLLQAQLSAEERLIGQQNTLTERERALTELTHTLTDEVNSLNQQATQTLQLIENLQNELNECQLAHEALVSQVQNAQHTVHTLAQQRQALEARYQATLQAHAEQEQRRQRIAWLAQEEATRRQHLEMLQQKLEQLQHAYETASEHEQRATETVEQLEQAWWQSERTVQQRLRELQHAQRQVEILRARAHALNASLQSGEGANPSVRALLQAVRKAELPPYYIPVSSALSIEEAYLHAINTALGSAVNDIITPTEADAKRAIEWLKRNRTGRLTFLPLELLEPAPSTDCPRFKGLIGRASDLVATDPEHQPAVLHLLGQVLIVETLDDAIALLHALRQSAQKSKAPRWARIVTLEGEVLQLSGVLSGGAQSHERQTLLHLKAELDNTLQNLQNAEQIARDAETAAETARTQHHKLHAELEQARQNLRHPTQARMQTENELKLARRDHEQTTRELTKLTQERERLQAESRREPLDDPESLQNERIALEHAYQEALQAYSQAQAQSTQLQAQRRELEKRLANERTQQERTHQRRQMLTQRLAQLQQEHNQIQNQRTQLTDELEHTRTQIDTLQHQLDTMRLQRQQLLETRFALTQQIKAKRQQRQSLGEHERTLELQIARLEVRLNEITDSWQRLCGDEPLPSPDPNEAARPAPVSRAEIERLRRTLQEMGEVNLGATDEYARLTERYQSLEYQHSDLQATCDQLKQNLHEIDAEARARFLQTYEQVRHAFQERFQRLFEGGSADLILTDVSDPLSAGVMVEAQPPNKRRQRLEWLSGGERALTALAMLFALNDVRPSPFYILDEVDAALDGRNVQRFADHLKEIAQTTQVLIVTHNPITTAVAQHWLGVTMTGGVSQIVPYSPRLDGLETDGVETHRAVVRQSQPIPQPQNAPNAHPPNTSSG